MAVEDLGPITLPPEPRPAPGRFEDYRRSVQDWARLVEKTFRQFETTVKALVDGKQDSGNYLTDAPADGLAYARKNGQWVSLSAVGGGVAVGSTLLGWWKLNEGSGVLTSDSSGNNYNGTLVNSPAWVTGASGSGNALAFVTASQQAVRFGNILNFTAPASFSVSIWFKTSSTAGNFPSLIGKTSTDAGFGYDLFLDSSTGKLHGQISDGAAGAGIISGSAVTDGVWHYAVVVVDRSAQTLTLYIDGVSQGTTSTSAVGSLTQTASLYLGVRQDSSGVLNFFTGSLDDARIYAGALTATEISTLYAAGAA